MSLQVDHAHLAILWPVCKGAHDLCQVCSRGDVAGACLHILTHRLLQIHEVACDRDEKKARQSEGAPSIGSQPQGGWQYSTGLWQKSSQLAEVLAEYLPARYSSRESRQWACFEEPQYCLRVILGSGANVVSAHPPVMLMIELQC